jgi:hypothetical protein
VDRGPCEITLSDGEREQLDWWARRRQGTLHARHRAIELEKLLQTIDREVRAELDVT